MRKDVIWIVDAAGTACVGSVGGFQGSPVVRRQIRGANSVGRVQTVALRLVVERELEIEGFTPESILRGS